MFINSADQINYSVVSFPSLLTVAAMKTPPVMDDAFVLEESKKVFCETTPDWLFTPTA